MQRYRMEPGVEHHSMSGHCGEPAVTAVFDPDGPWVLYEAAKILASSLMESERKRMEQENYINWKLRELEQANARLRELSWDRSPDRMGS
jgi:hypothetical protein